MDNILFNVNMIGNFILLICVFLLLFAIIDLRTNQVKFNERIEEIERYLNEKEVTRGRP